MAGTRLKQKLTNIADSIRQSLNITNLMSIDQMPPNIEDIQEITDSIIDGTISDTYVNSTVTALRTYAFSGCSILEGIRLNEVTDVISNYAFTGCSSLEFGQFSKAVRIGTYTFRNCSSLKSINTPILTRIYGNAFNGCTALEALIWDKITAVPDVTAGTFDNSGISTGTGYIYVPAELVEACKSAPVLQDYANQILPIEQLPQEYIDLYNIDITGASAESAEVPPPAPLQTIPVNRLDIDKELEKEILDPDLDRDLDLDIENNERI